MRWIGPFAYWLALAGAAGIGTVLWLAWLAGRALLGLLRLPFRAARRRRRAREAAHRKAVTDIEFTTIAALYPYTEAAEPERGQR